MQTKKQSAYEALINIAVGIGVSFGALYIIFPLLNIESSGSKNILITLFFTVVSFIRSYFLRRFFNWRHDKK
jgi:hypothetical protein